MKAPFQVSQNGIISAPTGSNLFTEHQRHDDGDRHRLHADVSRTRVEPASGVQAAVMAGAGPK